MLIIHEMTMGRHAEWLTAAGSHRYHQVRQDPEWVPSIGLSEEERWDIHAIFVMPGMVDLDAGPKRLKAIMDEQA